MRILLWATTLQADILALALHLDRRQDVQLLVAAEGVDAFRRSPVARKVPLRAPLLERSDAKARQAAEGFGADIVICDNHFPHFAAAPRLCSLWHGLGWKARPQADLPVFYRHVKRLTGTDPRQPNPRFLAQCYGESDLRWRVDNWGVAEDNCRVLGMAFSDLLRSPPYSKEELASNYRIDIAARRTLLLNFTWHYGRVFPGSWRPGWLSSAPFDEDLRFIERLFGQASDHGVNVLFCLHDRKRYESRYLEALRDLTQRFSHVELRHKDEHPDNLADLVVADAMVSNLSSFITFFYHFDRPTVHICPHPERDVRFARMRSGRLIARAENDGDSWMNEPTDNGGLSAFDADETLAAVDKALTNPDGCKARARSWIERHVWGVDGRTCERIHQALIELRGAS